MGEIMPVTEAEVLDALRKVIDPDLRTDIVTLKFVQNVKIDGDHIAFDVELTTPACPVKEELEAQCREVVSALEGVETVEINMRAQVRTRPGEGQSLIPGVKQVIAIASGKGGVGKSTVTVNLAVALAQQGAKVGLLDADVYGPSIPLMMGCPDEKPLARDEKIMPIERFGVRLMSLGFLLEEGQAVLWRGPMVAGTVKQLLSDVTWGELDYLLVDLPPGTGDAPMSLAQLVPLSGVVIVTTPHNVAANIAGKAAALFRRLNAPLLGVVENMAGYTHPETGEVIQIFSGMPGDALAKELKIPYLGSVPLDPTVSQSADRGVPSIIGAPSSKQAELFKQIAQEVARQSSILAVTREVDPAAAEPAQA